MSLKWNKACILAEEFRVCPKTGGGFYFSTSQNEQNIFQFCANQFFPGLSWI